MLVRQVLLCVCIACLGAAAHAVDSIQFWNADKLLSLGAAEVRLTGRDGALLGRIQRRRLLDLMEVKSRLEQASEVRTDLYIVTGEKPNAFASNVATGRNLFAVNLPMLDELGDDTDALAALMGHEIAHLERDHIRQKVEAAQNMQAGGNVAAILLALAGVRGAGAIATLGTNAVFGGYSRDQEREADIRGVGFAKAAGFNPFGAVRLFEKMNSAHGDRWVPFLATHPSHSERIATMREVAGNSTTVRATHVTALSHPNTDSEIAIADAAGEYSPTTYDAEERVPTLHSRVACMLPDGSVRATTKLDCIQREGTF